MKKIIRNSYIIATLIILPITSRKIHSAHFHEASTPIYDRFQAESDADYKVAEAHEIAAIAQKNRDAYLAENKELIARGDKEASEKYVALRIEARKNLNIAESARKLANAHADFKRNVKKSLGKKDKTLFKEPIQRAQEKYLSILEKHETLLKNDGMIPESLKSKFIIDTAESFPISKESIFTEKPSGSSDFFSGFTPEKTAKTDSESTPRPEIFIPDSEEKLEKTPRPKIIA